MSKPQENILTIVRQIQNSLNEQLLLNKGLNDIEHNERAKLLRTGLVVRGFASLEDFLKKRTTTILSQIPKAGISFYSLPDGFREQCTSGSLKASLFQANLIKKKKNNPEKYLQDIANEVASPLHGAFAIPKTIFGMSSSNLTADTIKDLFSSLRLSDPWKQMSKLSAKLKSPSPNLSSDIYNLIQSRHFAAHEPNATIEPTELSTYCVSIISMAISFDVLLSSAIADICSAKPTLLTGDKKDIADTIQIIYLEPENGLWKIKRDSAKKSLKVHSTYQSATNDLRQRVLTTGSAGVVLDATSSILKWYPPQMY